MTILQAVATAPTAVVQPVPKAEQEGVLSWTWSQQRRRSFPPPSYGLTRHMSGYSTRAAVAIEWSSLLPLSSPPLAALLDHPPHWRCCASATCNARDIATLIATSLLLLGQLFPNKGSGHGHRCCNHNGRVWMMMPQRRRAPYAGTVEAIVNNSNGIAKLTLEFKILIELFSTLP
jgi:hypothetical protein